MCFRNKACSLHDSASSKKKLLFMFSVSVKTPKESISYHCRGFFEPNWGLLCPLPSPQESLMLFLLISLPLSLTLPKWAHELRLLLFLLVQELAHSLWQWVKSLLGSSPAVVCAKMRCVQRLENVAEVVVESSILDLPELALECVLEKLPPAALCSMAGVCRNFKERCWSDHLWERHMREKWGRVLGRSAKREWECHVSCRKNYLQGVERRLKPKSLIESISCIWPLSWIKPLFDSSTSDRPTAANPLPIDSIMSWYLALESGKFWFPAQVYNRENGHVGFVLSCYDAQLSYDRQTDTFYARYPPHGRKPVKMEEGIEWSRIRASPVDTSPHDLHVSDCLNDLRPGDHFEIQWRKSKEFPYGWWYGVVGHLESCDEREHHCCCHKDDTIILEFKQYAPGSKWRKTDISRKNHREKGDETDGFYGGIRKLQRTDEISIWKRFWPSEVLE